MTIEALLESENADAGAAERLRELLNTYREANRNETRARLNRAAARINLVEEAAKYGLEIRSTFSGRDITETETWLVKP